MGKTYYYLVGISQWRETSPTSNLESIMLEEPNRGPKPGSDFTIDGLGMEMVWVEKGTFKLGGDEKPKHQVTLRQGFWLGNYEVTQIKFQILLAYAPKHQIFEMHPSNTHLRE